MRSANTRSAGRPPRPPRRAGGAGPPPAGGSAAPPAARGTASPAAPAAGAERGGPPADRVFADRIREADAFYARHIPGTLGEGGQAVVRQAYASLLWSKKFYHYVVKDWLEGDPAQPPPPASRRSGRNAEWGHLYNRDVISMPEG